MLLKKDQEPENPIYLNWRQIIESKEWIEAILDPKANYKFLFQK